jgi:hypothetical protein
MAVARDSIVSRSRMKLLRFGGHGSSEDESQFSQFEILTPEKKINLA